jgi:multidrug efflux pump subunit AcrB
MILGVQSKAEIQKKAVSSLPMSQVVKDIQLGFEESIIHHTNGKRSIKAQCDPTESSSPATARNSMLKAMEKIELPENYGMRWVGEYDMSKKAMTNIINLLPIAAILIVLVLVLLFNNVQKTLMTLLCLPLAAIGIVAGLLIFGQPFSFVAIVGTIGMAGMMIKNVIVLIEEIDLQIKSGIVPYDAIIKATVSRVRPVMMASLTTILGMIPLLPDPMYGALAVTVMCGLLVGTVITLIILPIMYAMFFKIKKQ